jgi:hypothetical protein
MHKPGERSVENSVPEHNYRTTVKEQAESSTNKPPGKKRKPCPKSYSSAYILTQPPSQQHRNPLKPRSPHVTTQKQVLRLKNKPLTQPNSPHLRREPLKHQTNPGIPPATTPDRCASPPRTSTTPPYLQRRKPPSSGALRRNPDARPRDPAQNCARRRQPPRAEQRLTWNSPGRRRQ